MLVTAKNYIGECKAIIYGDSITYGQATSISEAYSYKLASYLGNSFVSGMSAGTISQVLDRLDTENKSQIPNYTICCIGTNGGNTPDRLKTFIEKCLEINSTPILCTTPQLGDTIGVSSTNAQIISVCEQYGLIPVRFDIATSIGNNPNNGRNTDLFRDSVHPNAAGHLAMYNRIFIDYPELINIINNQN